MNTSAIIKQAIDLNKKAKAGDLQAKRAILLSELNDDLINVRMKYIFSSNEIKKIKLRIYARKKQLNRIDSKINN